MTGNHRFGAGLLGATLLLFALHSSAAQGTHPSPSFRVLEWNVSDSAYVRHPEESKAVMRHADPDIVILVEVAPNRDPGSIRSLLTGLRGPSDTTWFISFRNGGAGEYAVIASRDSLRELPEFAHIPYPETGRAIALASPPDSDARGKASAAAELVHANGVLARVRNRWVMVVAVHLTCCGTPGTWREYRRQLGATMIRSRVQDALSQSKADGLVIAGDMNLVSGRAALDTLLQSTPRGPLGPMLRAEALQPDGWTDWTWDGRGTAFNGGRLDNILFSSGSMTATNARIWDTEFLPSDTLRAHGLTAGSGQAINHHRQVTVDLRFAK